MAEAAVLAKPSLRMRLYTSIATHKSSKICKRRKGCEEVCADHTASMKSLCIFFDKLRDVKKHRFAMVKRGEAMRAVLEGHNFNAFGCHILTR